MILSFLIKHGTCASAILYVLLTFVAILSPFSPCLSRLAAHGKTRISMVVLQEQNKSTSSSIISKWKSFLDHPWLKIRKEYFTTFYSLGFMWSVTILSYSNHVVSRTHQSQIAAIYLLYLHLFRRYLECRFVHVWNGTMHLAGYALGLLHYFLLPFVFLSNYDEYDRVNILRTNSSSSSSNTLALVIGIVLNVVAQYYQYVHHCILARYRNYHRSRNVKQRTEAKQEERHHKIESLYTIPSGCWFDYVSCPHYLAEILIYLSFAILLYPIMRENELQQRQQQQEDATSSTCYMKYLCFWCEVVRPWRHVILVCWVFANLAVSARASHTWYKRTFPSYPKHKKALLPWLW